MITIRRFSSGDNQPIRTLIDQIMHKEFGDARQAYPSEDIDDIPKYYGAIGEAFFVAIDDGHHHVVGTVGIKKEDDRVALLRRLFVTAVYRRQQIGAKLVDRALQFCDDLGYQEVVFKTTSGMEGAIKTCQKRGFVQRAKLQLGDLELLKFSVSLRNGAKSLK